MTVLKRNVVATLIGLSFCLGSVDATPIPLNIGDHINVAEGNVNPARIVKIVIGNPGNPFYSGWAYAGVNELLVTKSGVTAVDYGFCIDPFHYSSSSSLPYTVMELEDGPKAATNPLFSGAMGPDKALQIQKLWAMHFSTDMSADEAAGMQIAIWEIVGSNIAGQDYFKLAVGQYDYHANDFIIDLVNYNLDIHGTLPELVALSGAGQDYVVAHVPDGGMTLALMSASFLGLVLSRRRRVDP